MIIRTSLIGERLLENHEVQSVTLKISRYGTGKDFKIVTGMSSNFVSDKTILIGDKNPNLLWNLLYELVGIPFPKFIDPEKKEKQTVVSSPAPVKDLTPIEAELSGMAASDIVAKVFQEKGIQITNSLKSKAAIIKKALKIYEGQ